MSPRNRLTFVLIAFFLASIAGSWLVTRVISPDDHASTVSPANQSAASAPSLPQTSDSAAEVSLPKSSFNGSERVSPGDSSNAPRADTETQSLLFSAVDANKQFITELSREDIRVLEDGVPQEVTGLEQRITLPLSLALLFDTGLSQSNPLTKDKTAVLSFIESILRAEKDRAAVISFTRETKVEQQWTRDAGQLRQAVERLQLVQPNETQSRSPGTGRQSFQTARRTMVENASAIWDALTFTCQDVLAAGPASERRAIILLTDGEDAGSHRKMSEAIEAALKANVVIYAVGLGSPQKVRKNRAALQELSEQTGGRAFFPADEKSLRAAFAEIQKELRAQYLVTYLPANKKRDGSYRKLRIEIVGPRWQRQRLRLTHRPGHYPGAPAYPSENK